MSLKSSTLAGGFFTIRAAWKVMRAELKVGTGAANMQGILVRECWKSNGQIGF